MPGGEFDLGIQIGPRGFADHSFTGTNAFLLAAEYRYTVTNDFLNTAGLGLAAFADYGGAWYSGSRQRSGYAVGIGMRFGLTVASDLSPARLDLAYTDGDGLNRGAWRLAFGKGFVFSTTGRLDR
jgi:outer membrane protein assembly factor BamA